MRKLLLFAALLLAALPASATTYYISSSTGSDSNNGTAKATPWAHVKGMVGASGNANSHTPAGDDIFIFMGCDSWTNGVFPISVTWSGTSGHPITYGVDKTWYNTTNCPSAWNRPKFDASGTPIATHNNFVRMTGGGGAYTTWDNIEFTGYSFTAGGSYGDIAFFCTGACSGSITNVTITNNYFHNWTHGAATTDGLYVLLGSTNSPYMSGSLVDSNVFDNSDGDTTSGNMMYGWSGTITNNFIKNVSNGILPMGAGGVVAYNRIDHLNFSFDVTVHENCFETLNGGTATWYIHDNVCSNGQVGESMMTGNPGETDYIWNNVVYNWSGNAFHFPQVSGYTPTAIHYWNNTIVPVAGGNCVLQQGSVTMNQLDFQNNHCITTAAAVNGTISGVTTVNIDHNTLQTPTAATGQGFTSAETYAYSPPTSGLATQASGLNLTSSCSGSLATMCNDTSYAVTEQTVGGVVQVVAPARTTVARPNSAWDTGAYQYAAAAPSTPRAAGRMMAMK